MQYSTHTLGSLTGTGPIVAPGVQLQLGHGAQLPGLLSPLAAAPRQVVDGEVEAAVHHQQQVARLEQPGYHLYGEG